MRWLPFGNSSDRSWQWYGENDPYYGVLSTEEYRRDNLSEQKLAEFFESGSRHVDRVLTAVGRHFGEMRKGSCLDFGCGVGRLVIPFASRFEQVVGVDISPAMIEEAKSNCRRHGVGNVAFHRRIDDLQRRFDFVHSYIVIQHIPVARGLAIIDGLLDLLESGGAAFIQMSIGRQSGALRNFATAVRKNVPLVHRALNLLQRRRLAEEYMQVNDYPVNAILARLYDRGIQQVWCEIENHQGSYGVCLVFRRPQAGA